MGVAPEFATRVANYRSSMVENLALCLQQALSFRAQALGLRKLFSTHDDPFDESSCLLILPRHQKSIDCEKIGTCHFTLL